MDRTKILACLIAVALLTSCGGSSGVVRVGSKNFTEQVILGEIIAQHLALRHFKVERSLNLGGTLLAHQALASGQIDLYPEYTGTGLTAVLKDPVNTDSARVLAQVRSEYSSRFHIEWLNPLGIDNGFAMVISGKSPAQTLTEAASQPQPWKLGVGYEFEQRSDGLEALKKAYSLRIASTQTMDLGLLYKALSDGQVGMIAANATDGLLTQSEFKILRDDKHAFPPYEVCILARQDTLMKTPGLREALAELSGKFTNQTMQQLNYEVDVQHRAVAVVAAAFLKQAGLE